jgi:hypothetical protein
MRLQCDRGKGACMGRITDSTGKPVGLNQINWKAVSSAGMMSRRGFPPATTKREMTAEPQ